MAEEMVGCGEAGVGDAESECPDCGGPLEYSEDFLSVVCMNGCGFECLDDPDA